jgi:hypothetical protein
LLKNGLNDKPPKYSSRTRRMVIAIMMNLIIPEE